MAELANLKSRQSVLLLSATVAVSALGFFAGSAINIAVPRIQQSLGLDINQVQWIINIYTLVLAVLILVAGSISDQFGRKRIMLFGLALFSISNMACLFTNSYEVLIILRLAQGVGAALIIPQSLAIINNSFADKLKAQAIGIWSGAAGAVMMIAPVVGGVLVDSLGWKAVFVLSGALAAACLMLVQLVIPDVKPLRASKVRDIDWLGVVLVSGAIGVGTLSLTEIAGKLGSANPSIGSYLAYILLLICSIILGIAFIFWQRSPKNGQPLIRLSIFRSKPVLVANIFTLLLYSIVSFVPFVLSLYLQQQIGLSATQTGLYQLPLSIVITLLTFFTGKLADSRGTKFVLTLGALLVAIGGVVLTALGAELNQLIFFAGIVLVAGGFGIFVPGLTKAALLVKPELSGAASGVNNAISRFGGTIGIVLASSVIAIVGQGNLVESTRILMAAAAVIAAIALLISHFSLQVKTASPA